MAGKWQLPGLRAVGIHVPVGPQFFLDDLAHAVQFFQVVAGRRQDDAEHQIAVAGRQVLDFGPQPVTDGHRSGDQHQHHAHATGQAPLHAGVDSHDVLHERAAEPIQRPQPPPAGQGHFVGVRAGAVTTLPQQPGSCDRDQRRRHDHRQAHRGTDRQGDVAEQLARFFFHEQHGQEHRQRRGGRSDHRAPNLCRPPLRSLHRRDAQLVMPIDVLQHDDRIVDQHPHGKRQPGQADDV